MIPFADLYAATPPACEHREPTSDEELDDSGCIKKKEKKPWERGSVFGVRLAVLSTNGAEKDGTYIGAMAAVNSEQYQVGKIFSAHGSSFGYLGGGSAGFEGGLGATLTLGARAPLAETHGPIARVGMAGEMQGNKRFYYSRLVLPMAEIGYQYATPDAFTILELGGRGGNVISGRYNTGNRTHRKLGDGALEWGFYGAAHTKLTRFDISYTRIQADDNFPGGAVGTLRGLGCFYVGMVGICGDGMLVTGKGYTGLPRVASDVTTIYAGLTVGLADL